MAIIRITDLKLRPIIGANEWERDIRQDIIINLEIDYDSSAAVASDDLDDALDYRELTKKISGRVEASSCHLIEKLADLIMNTVMEDKMVNRASARVDKPHALRFAESVSVGISRKRDSNQLHGR